MAPRATARLRSAAGRLKRTVHTRLSPQQGRTGRGADPPPCLVCASKQIRSYRVVYHTDDRLTCRVRRCHACGYVQMVRPVDKYRKMTSFDQLPGGSRAGRVDRAGREFHMGKMALDMIGGTGRDVLIFGVGRSMDHVHLERLPETGYVAIGDIMRIRDEKNFVDISRPARRRFDVVIASEVIEHFRDPRHDFDRLFEFAEPDGLVVAGTNIYNGSTPLARCRYIFYPDHTSFYTPEVLRTIANDRGWMIDFRATGGGPKRYVLMSRSAGVMQDVACYFGREPYAPSEVAQPAPLPPQRSHAQWRAGTPR